MVPNLNLIAASLSSFTLLLGVLFVAYVSFILVPFLRATPTVAGDETDFDWHLFIPCRDEEVVIAATIQRARHDFPTAHLWVIDDDSDDDTCAIALSYAAIDRQVHVVQRRRPNARTGKGDALNSAYAHLDAFLPRDAEHSQIIVVTVDADGQMAPNALAMAASDTVFGNPEMGAAQVTVWMRNRADSRPFPDKGRFANFLGAYLTRMQDVEFRTTIAAMQALRTKTGTVGLGGNGQFTRLSVLDLIAREHGEPWHGALLEDYELGVHVLLAGYQIRHINETHVSQEALPSLRRLIAQRTRWAQGNIQCIKYIPHIIKSPYFTTAGILETSYYLVLPFLQMLGAAASIVILTENITTTTSRLNEFHFNVDFTLAILGLVLAFSIAPFTVWGFVYRARCEPQASLSKALLWGIGVWIYVYYMYVCIACAFCNIVRGKTEWAKTRRNGDTDMSGPIAIRT